MKKPRHFARTGHADLRPEQRLIVDRTFKDIAAGRISLVEAATGTGKGFAMALAAARALEELSMRPVVLAAPSLSVLKQDWDEWRRVGHAAKTAIVLGRRQFVDPDAIEHLLNNGYDDAGVLKWWANGGRSTDNPSTAALREAYPEICWLADDLAHVASDFPVDDVRLDDDATAEASFWYDRLREDAQDADLVFCTHAMLALDNQLRTRKNGPGSILPAARLLLLDEAHLFEQAVAGAASHGLALSRLRALLGDTPGWASARLASRASAALRSCDAVIESCREIPVDHTFPLDPKDDAHLRKRIAVERSASQLLRDLKDLSSKKLEQSLDVDLVRRRFRVSAAIRALESMLSGKQRVQLSFAPVRRYPTITAGPLSVRHLLTSLWNRTEAAALFSATLCLPGADGALDDGYMRTVLAIPGDRASSHDPIVPEWVTRDVALHFPGETKAPQLIPPGRGVDEAEYGQAMDQWAAAVASEIASSVAPTAVGGTLVLVPSKDATTRIAAFLAPVVGSRLLVHSDALSVHQAKSRFVDAHHADLRPIWIATGPAWTGLDLSDPGEPDPARDTLLTDLVIARLPFGVNRSPTQLARETWMGYRATLAEALMQFKQGIGRLVRRPGLHGRRLWLLDGRISAPTHRNRLKPALVLLSAYRHRVEF